MPRQRAQILDVGEESHNSDQVHVESVPARIRNKVGGSRSSVRADGGTVAHMVALVLCLSGPPDQAPLSSFGLANL